MSFNDIFKSSFLEIITSVSPRCLCWMPNFLFFGSRVEC